MGNCGEIKIFSIFGCKIAKMTVILAGMLSEDQKMDVAKDV